MRQSFYLLTIVLYIFISGPACADKARIAVAANFIKTVKQLKTDFEKHSSHSLLLSSGSSGKLYAQIINGAPFDIFLSADIDRPEKLEKTEFALPKTRFTYALGKLILWTGNQKLKQTDHTILKSKSIKRLAIANPKTAPYGVAALEVINTMKVGKLLEKKLVYGENITQTYQFIATGAAQAGFISSSQLSSTKTANIWIVPEDMYAPIRQQAILLKKSQNNPAARAFYTYLKSPAARTIIQQNGYGLE